MKKTSLLLAIGALLYGASGSYALAKIYPGMIEQEILDVLEAYGVTSSDPIAEVMPEDAAMINGTAALSPPPANVWVDDSTIYSIQSRCWKCPPTQIMRSASNN